MKKKEILKRIEALEAIVKPIADLQKASDNAKGLECKIYLSKGPYSPEVMKYYLKPVSDDVVNAFFNRFKTEEKKELEVGKWCCVSYGSYDSTSAVDAIIFYEGNDRSYGFNHEGEWTEMYLTSKDSDFIKDFKREATPQEVEEALIKESKKRYKKGDIVSFFDNTSNKVRLEGNDFGYLHENIILYASDIGKDIVFQNGKWAEIVEENKQYTPKIGDVVKAWEYHNSGTFIIGRIDRIINDTYPYFIGYCSYSNVEPITDENIIKLFN